MSKKEDKIEFTQSEKNIRLFFTTLSVLYFISVCTGFLNPYIDALGFFILAVALIVIVVGLMQSEARALAMIVLSVLLLLLLALVLYLGIDTLIDIKLSAMTAFNLYKLLYLLIPKTNKNIGKKIGEGVLFMFFITMLVTYSIKLILEINTLDVFGVLVLSSVIGVSLLLCIFFFIKLWSEKNIFLLLWGVIRPNLKKIANRL